MACVAGRAQRAGLESKTVLPAIAFPYLQERPAESVWLARYARLKSAAPLCVSGRNECGGFGRLASNQRNYSVNEALESLGDVNTLISYGHDPEARLRFGSRNPTPKQDACRVSVETRCSPKL